MNIYLRGNAKDGPLPFADSMLSITAGLLLVTSSLGQGLDLLPDVMSHRCLESKYTLDIFCLVLWPKDLWVLKSAECFRRYE